MRRLLSSLSLKSSECSKNAASANCAETQAVGRGISNSLLQKVGEKQIQVVIVPFLRQQLHDTDANDYRDTVIEGPM